MRRARLHNAHIKYVYCLMRHQFWVCECCYCIDNGLRYGGEMWFKRRWDRCEWRLLIQVPGVCASLVRALAQNSFAFRRHAVSHNHEFKGPSQLYLASLTSKHRIGYFFLSHLTVVPLAVNRYILFGEDTYLPCDQSNIHLPAARSRDLYQFPMA